MKLPELYQEEKFLEHFVHDDYVKRQASSARYLVLFYRRWLKEAQAHADQNPFRARCYAMLLGPLTHLANVHEMQAAGSDLQAHESWYLTEMYKRCSAQMDSVKLAVHAVMYCRGLQRYRMLLSTDGEMPWRIWERDAELNAMLCLELLATLEGTLDSNVLKAVVLVETEIVKEIEARK